MKYKPVLLDDGSSYLVAIPEYATEPPMDKRDKVILELWEKLEKFKLLGLEGEIDR